MATAKFISWQDISLEGGFWRKWQETVAKRTSNAIYDRFYETGRINAMKLDWKEGMPDRPHIFWDSDIAKWMEGTAYLLHYAPDEALRQKLETIIDYIEKGQDENGYFNSAFLTLHPEAKFTDRTDHELYTAGHFIEAAIAHYHTTKDKRFLQMMMRFADYIETVFVKENSATFKTPGHQEVELALFRLWETTGERRYLELSKHFVDTRGTDPSERIFSVPNGTPPAFPLQHNQLEYNDTYAQDEAPARELTAAGGHAVRAMYFYTAMADLAREYKDDALFAAAKRLWEDSTFKKMYVTGGISAEKYGEAIGTDYVLPNDYSYAETCASVAMANFSQRMFTMEQDGRYADMIERQMYNGALVGLAIDGGSFYYDNALLSRPEVNRFFEGIHARFTLPANQRLKVFDCSCCPPNVYRFIAAVGQYFYASAEDTLYVHQYGQSTANVMHQGQNFTLVQKTDYPWSGEIALQVKTEAPVQTTLAVRIPGWCKGAVITVNGQKVDQKALKGYVYLDGLWQEDTIALHFDMPVVQLMGNPKIIEAAGKVALMRGPLVYCLESCDNDFPIFDIILQKDATPFALGQTNIEGVTFMENGEKVNGFSVTSLSGGGYVQELSVWDGTLYQEHKPVYRKVAFTAVPYFAWANRGPSSMSVWLQKQQL